MVTTRKAETGTAEPIIQTIADQDPVRWYNKPNLRYLYFLLFITCMGIELTSGFDSQMINALQIVPAWQTYFGDKPDGQFSGELKGIIAAAYSLGAILSLPFIGVVNDRFGRRWSIFGGSAIMVAGAIIQGFSVHVGMYVVARLLLGFGIPTCIVSGSSLIGELGYPKERAYLTCFFNVAFYLGQIVAAGICFGTNNIPGNMAWKIPSWLQLVPSMMQILFIFLVPESPRWLITKDRSEEAYEILAKYHAEGDRDSDFVKAEFAHIQTTIKLEMENSSQSYMDLIKTAGMRRRTLISAMLGLFTQWSGNTLISYYLNDILDMIGRTSSIFKQQINLGLSCWSLVCGVTIVLTCVRLKRVTAAYITTIGMLVIYVAWTIAMERSMDALDAGKRNNAAGIAVLFFIFAYKPAYQVFYNALTYTYLVEIWPYAERSRGIALSQFFSRGAGFATTFINPIGLDNIGWKFFIMYCVVLVFEVAFVYFFFAETSGRTLEELSFLFEDKDLAEAANEAAIKASDHAHVEVTSEKKV
ncbi:Lactose permease-like protein [Hapsidospora chrysogenum ATCC 11550]|uniref:Lactose permease-like protein n=1 Tax=Hapsidospora chrysogenum (strain ATCC 11550 / CBS 779.69 / DSM 880 / IAM 14645 / JCM 23072 / IMI 49137) TaxID=857340 RepID=A0A086SZE0_HAPC1|nr:Lactose permease-like protein [Hapsidospora chrysogenum ATCC 11550]